VVPFEKQHWPLLVLRVTSDFIVDQIRSTRPAGRDNRRPTILKLAPVMIDAVREAGPPHQLCNDTTIAEVARIQSAGLRTICRPRCPPFTTISLSAGALASMKLRRRFRCPRGLIPPTSYPVVRSAFVFVDFNDALDHLLARRFRHLRYLLHADCVAS
jgi:hypothetical protein